MRSRIITRPLYSSGARTSSARPAQDDAVEELGLVGGQDPGEPARDSALVVVVGLDTRGKDLGNGHLLEQRRDLLERTCGREAELAQAIDRRDQAAPSRRATASIQRIAWLRSTAPSIWRTPSSSIRPLPCAIA